MSSARKSGRRMDFRFCHPISKSAVATRSPLSSRRNMTYTARTSAAVSILVHPRYKQCRSLHQQTPERYPTELVLCPSVGVCMKQTPERYPAELCAAPECKSLYQTNSETTPHRAMLCARRAELEPYKLEFRAGLKSGHDSPTLGPVPVESN